MQSLFNYNQTIEIYLISLHLLFFLVQIADCSDLCVVGQGKNTGFSSQVSTQMKRWDLWIDSFETTMRSIVIDQIDIDAAQ